MTIENDQLATQPYSVGVLLAVNALQDAWLLLDAPPCAFYRPGYIQDSHDWNSTLWDASGFHRVQITGTRTDDLVQSAARDVPERLARMAALPGCGAVLAVGFPLVALTGVQHDALWRSLDPVPDVPFFPVRGGRLEEDWLDGFAETLLALARGLDLGVAAPDPRRVAVVGYPWDRNEGDHAANVAEVVRLLEAMDLEVVSVWPSGGRVRDLAAAATAGTVLAMPHGREAAAELARRLGARMVTCDLPFGLEGTARFLSTVGESTGRERHAEEVTRSELAFAVPRVERAVSRVLRGARIAAFVDPHYLRPLARLADEVGATLVRAVGRSGEAGMERLGPWDDLPCPVSAAPSRRGLAEIGEALRCDVTVGSFDVPLRFVELGYPSFRQHALTDRPFLGFRGAVSFLERLSAEVLSGRGETAGPPGGGCDGPAPSDGTP